MTIPWASVIRPNSGSRSPSRSMIDRTSPGAWSRTSATIRARNTLRCPSMASTCPGRAGLGSFGRHFGGSAEPAAVGSLPSGRPRPREDQMASVRKGRAGRGRLRRRRSGRRGADRGRGEPARRDRGATNSQGRASSCSGRCRTTTASIKAGGHRRRRRRARRRAAGPPGRPAEGRAGSAGGDPGQDRRRRGRRGSPDGPARGSGRGRLEVGELAGRGRRRFDRQATARRSPGSSSSSRKAESCDSSSRFMVGRRG